MCLTHTWLETHIYHPVSFVQHNVSTLIQYEISIFQNVYQTSGRSDDNLQSENDHLTKLTDLTRYPACKEKVGEIDR